MQTEKEMSRKEQLIEDLSDMEDILIQMEESADIWQNRVVKALARAVYHILTYLVKEKS